MKRRWAAAREQPPVRSSPTFHGTPRDGGQGLPGCFAGIARYAEGRWLPTSREAPYRLEHSLWRQMNVLRMPGNSNDHWGLCTDVALGPSGPAAVYGPTKLSGRARNVARQQYEWVPSRCSLARFDRRRACRVLDGKQVLVAGDSATAQFFLSLVLQLGGPRALGHNRRGGSAVLKDLTASACEDNVRLNFVRNDLLAWTSQVDELRELGKLCTSGRALLQPFAGRVRDADILILGTGHHYPHVPLPAGKESRDSVFLQSLNHTLSNVLRVRAEAGHAPQSVVLLGAPVPVAGCSRFSAPITPAQALAANSSLNKWSDHWQQSSRFSQFTQRDAAERGVNFIDVAPLSVQRPDDTLARWCRLSGLDCYKREDQLRKQLLVGAQQQRKTGHIEPLSRQREMRRSVREASFQIVPDADYLEEDCLHTCLPGPVDEYVRLLYNLLRSRTFTARRPNTYNTSANRIGQLDRPQRRGRFFASNLSSWLYTHGAEKLEPCTDASDQRCAFLTAEQGLAHCAPWSAYPPSLQNRAYRRHPPGPQGTKASAKLRPKHHCQG